MADDEVKTDIAHASWAVSHCSGHLKALIRNDTAEIICDECGSLSWTLPTAELADTITRMKNTRPTTLGHSDFGDADCCGCFNGFIRGEQADIVCNVCGTLIRTVPTADLERTLSEMELTLDVCSEQCPYCRSVNLISGFATMMAYTCRSCGRLVRLSDDPNVERIIGPADEQE